VVCTPRKSCTVSLGPPTRGGGTGLGVGLRNGRGSRVAGGLGKAAQQDREQAWSPLASLPCLSCRGVEGLGGNCVLPSIMGRTWLSGAGSASGLFLGGALSPGRVLSPWPATHTLTSSSSSASANSKVFACTVLGTGALLPAWGAPHSSSRLSQEARAWGSTPPSSWLQASIPV